jgi:hypothetical protein
VPPDRRVQAGPGIQIRFQPAARRLARPGGTPPGNRNRRRPPPAPVLPNRTGTRCARPRGRSPRRAACRRATRRPRSPSNCIRAAIAVGGRAPRLPVAAGRRTARRTPAETSREGSRPDGTRWVPRRTGRAEIGRRGQPRLWGRRIGTCYSRRGQSRACTDYRSPRTRLRITPPICKSAEAMRSSHGCFGVVVQPPAAPLEDSFLALKRSSGSARRVRDVAFIDAMGYPGFARFKCAASSIGR